MTSLAPASEQQAGLQLRHGGVDQPYVVQRRIVVDRTTNTSGDHLGEQLDGAREVVPGAGGRCPSEPLAPLLLTAIRQNEPGSPRGSGRRRAVARPAAGRRGEAPASSVVSSVAVGRPATENVVARCISEANSFSPPQYMRLVDL